MHSRNSPKSSSSQASSWRADQASSASSGSSASSNDGNEGWTQAKPRKTNAPKTKSYGNRPGKTAGNGSSSGASSSVRQGHRQESAPWQGHKGPLGTTEIKNSINRGLAAFNGFPGLISFVKEEVNKLKTPESVAKFLETTISWSLHEIYDDPELLELLKKAHESDGHKIVHWAVWSRYKTHPHELEELKSFDRTDDDILQTIRLCLRVGSSPLDVNTHQESAIGSLIASFKKGNLSKETFNAAYDILTEPSSEHMEKMCCNATNLIGEGMRSKKTRIIKRVETKYTPTKFWAPILSWMIYRDAMAFCKALVINLRDITKAARDPVGYYKSVHDRIVLISDILNEGPTNSENHDFDWFFEKHDATPKELVQLFNKSMMKVCSQIDFSKQISTITGDQLNIDIIGALVGEVAPNAGVVLFSQAIMREHPSVAKTCLIHKKKANGKFKCTDQLISDLADQYSAASDGSTRFQILGTINLLTGTEHNNNSVIALRLSSSSSSSSSSSARPASCASSVVRAPVVETAMDVNPYLQKINFSKLLQLDKDGTTVACNNGTLSPEYIDDLAYGLSKQYDQSKKAGDTTRLFEAIAMNAMESLSSENQIHGLCQILVLNGWTSAVQDVIRTSGQEYLECVGSENPKWAKTIVDTILAM